MKQITRSKTGTATNRAAEIYETVAALLNKIEKRPIRLVGITLSGFTTTPNRQLTLFDDGSDLRQDKLGDALMKLQLKYGRGIIKPANVLRAEKRLSEGD
jgi:hypothetical protein